MKKLPQITISEWLEAERSMIEQRVSPQPKGSVSADQYAEAMGISSSQARRRLLALLSAGVATRQEWYTGGGGSARRLVYSLKSKKS